MFRVPNNWRVDSSGKFVKDIETEEFKAALAYTRDLWASGLFYADALTTTSSEQQDQPGRRAVRGVSGRLVLLSGGVLGQGPQAESAREIPHACIRSATTAARPIWHQYQAFNGMTALKKGSPERIKEMLRILNYLAAPFGSEEAFLLEFGVKDVDYTLDANGNPVLTPQGQADTVVSWRYMAQRPQVLFDPNDPEFAKVAHADEETIMPVIIPDPSLGLISTTYQSKGGVLLKNLPTHWWTSSSAVAR